MLVRIDADLVIEASDISRIVDSAPGQRTIYLKHGHGESMCYTALTLDEIMTRLSPGFSAQEMFGIGRVIVPMGYELVKK